MIARQVVRKPVSSPSWNGNGLVTSPKTNSNKLRLPPSPRTRLRRQRSAAPRLCSSTASSSCSRFWNSGGRTTPHRSEISKKINDEHAQIVFLIFFSVYKTWREERNVPLDAGKKKGDAMCFCSPCQRIGKTNVSLINKHRK